MPDGITVHGGGEVSERMLLNGAAHGELSQRSLARTKRECRARRLSPIAISRAMPRVLSARSCASASSTRGGSAGGSESGRRFLPAGFRTRSPGRCSGFPLQRREVSSPPHARDSAPMDEQTVSLRCEGLGIGTISNAERAKLKLEPVDGQDRRAARGYEIAPSVLALERGQTICGEIDGYGRSQVEAVGTPTWAIRRPAGSMWIVVPPKTARRCERRIGTEVAVARRRDGSYAAELCHPRMADGKIRRCQASVQSAELARAPQRDEASTHRRGSASRRCLTRRTSRHHLGNRKPATKAISTDPDAEPPQHRRTPGIGGARSSRGGELRRPHASTGHDVVTFEVRR